MEQRKKPKHIQISNSRRKTTPENRLTLSKKPVGCMSGIFNLLSRHQSRRRISSAARKEKIKSPPSASNPISTQPDLNLESKFPIKGDGLSQRSPMIPLEIRRSGCFGNGESSRRGLAILPRLMGLEENLKPDLAVDLSSDSAEEKRRDLIGALERCDEDLRELKRIIDAVRVAEMKELKSDFDGNVEQPSPVSVLDGLWSPKHVNVGKKSRSSHELNCHLHRPIPIEEIRRPLSDNKRTSAAATKAASCGRWRCRWRRSDAMVESVGEVVEEAVCEERREAIRVGLDLADDVVADIVCQLVIEMVETSKFCFQTLRCKRKLSF